MDISPTGKQNSLPVAREDATPAASQAQAPKPPQAQDSKTGSTALPKTFDSPVVQIDPTTESAVLSFRDGKTGEQTFQLPSRSALEYSRRQSLTEHQTAPAKHGGTVTA
jgi:hypothetical protein